MPDQKLSNRLISEKTADRIRHAIQEGKFSPDVPLPSYRTIAHDERVSVWTVRAALDILEREGMLYRRERSGTFVRRPMVMARSGAASALRCINFVSLFDWDSFAPQYHFTRVDYLAGYTEALEPEDIKMRDR